MENSTTLSTEAITKLNAELKSLLEKKEQAEDFETKLEIQDRIHNINMTLKGIKPDSSSNIDCVGCGS